MNEDGSDHTHRDDRAARHVITNDADGPASVWDVAKGEKIATLEGPVTRFKGAAMSPTGTHFAATDDDRLVLWHIPSGRRIAEATSPRRMSGRIAFSSDGLHVVSAHGVNAEIRSIESFGDPQAIGDEDHVTGSRRCQLLSESLRRACALWGCTISRPARAFAPSRPRAPWWGRCAPPPTDERSPRYARIAPSRSGDSTEPRARD